MYSLPYIPNIPMRNSLYFKEEKEVKPHFPKFRGLALIDFVRLFKYLKAVSLWERDSLRAPCKSPATLK